MKIITGWLASRRVTNLRRMAKGSHGPMLQEAPPPEVALSRTFGAPIAALVRPKAEAEREAVERNLREEAERRRHLRLPHKR